MDGRQQAAALDSLASARVVLLGERHDRADDHRWQRDVIAGIVDRAGRVAVGLEMLPRRAQAALDAFSAGELAEEAFFEAVDWAGVWGFPPALYRGILALCRARGLPLVALNCDRPLVSLIGRDGWEALPQAERAWLSPAAPAPPGYRRYLFDVTGGARPDRRARGPEDPAFDRFVRAQGVWDRAFACAIAARLAAHPGERLVGLIGRGHLEYGWGTPLQLADLGVAPVLTALPDAVGAEEAHRSAAARPVADYVWGEV